MDWIIQCKICGQKNRIPSGRDISVAHCSKCRGLIYRKPSESTFEEIRSKISSQKKPPRYSGQLSAGRKFQDLKPLTKLAFLFVIYVAISNLYVASKFLDLVDMAFSLGNISSTNVILDGFGINVAGRFYFSLFPIALSVATLIIGCFCIYAIFVVKPFAGFISGYFLLIDGLISLVFSISSIGNPSSFFVRAMFQIPSISYVLWIILFKLIFSGYFLANAKKEF